MDRDPKIAIKRILRKEVGFGCPILGCGNPYLTWHHFDPPWHEEKHHNPDGMIALCQDHHKQADAGVFTKEQLRDFKKNGQKVNIEGSFNWMRRSLIFAGGGNFVVDPYVILKYNGENIIWFTRDENGYLLLNINFKTGKGTLRFEMEENFWNIIEPPLDMVCTPSGKKIEIRYQNGDKLLIEFSEILDNQTFNKRFNTSIPIRAQVEFPVTIVNIRFEDADKKFEFTNRTKMPGMIVEGSWSRSPHTLFSLNDRNRSRQ